MKKLLILPLVIMTCISFAQKEKKYYDKAMAKAEASDYDGAIKLLDKAIETNSDYTEGYNARGEMYGHKHEHQKAIDNYSSSLKIDANQKEILFKRAQEKMKLHQLNAAIPDLSKVIELDNKHAKAYLNRGECYSKTKQVDKACEDWNKAAELGNRNAKALVGMKCKKK